MLFVEFEAEIGKPNAIVPDTTLHVEAGTDGHCVVDGIRALPLAFVSPLLPRGQPLSILDGGGFSIADVLLCEGENFDIPRFGAPYLAAYLEQAAASGYGQPGSFDRNFLVVRVENLDDYRARFMEGSPIWGGFQHLSPGTPVVTTTHNAPLTAVPNLKLPTDVHVEIARRSVQQVHAFERYLRLYHLLELSFDLSIVQQIRGLGDDLRGVGQIFSSLQSKELERLKSIIRQSRTPGKIVECVRDCTSDPRWSQQIRTIFFEFGKEGNPLAAREGDFFDALAAGGYSYTSMRTVASIPNGVWDASRQKKFEDFTLQLVSYWIYRIRSSIAHSRLGEYVMRDSDEPFVALFAEPLLRCVLAQVL